MKFQPPKTDLFIGGILLYQSCSSTPHLLFQFSSALITFNNPKILKLLALTMYTSKTFLFSLIREDEVDASASKDLSPSCPKHNSSMNKWISTTYAKTNWKLEVFFTLFSCSSLSLPPASTAGTVRAAPLQSCASSIVACNLQIGLLLSLVSLFIRLLLFRGDRFPFCTQKIRHGLEISIWISFLHLLTPEDESNEFPDSK